MVQFVILPFYLFVHMWMTCGVCSGNSPARPQQESYADWKSIVVTASAYNSLESQGVGDPSITAWGDTLDIGVKSVAVSRDLLQRGIDYGTSIKIKGLDGVYIVNDKMHRRWKNKIDIYMGTDRKKALEWGRRTVEICFPDQKN